MAALTCELTRCVAQAVQYCIRVKIFNHGQQALSECRSLSGLFGRRKFAAKYEAELAKMSAVTNSSSEGGNEYGQTEL